MDDLDKIFWSALDPYFYFRQAVSIGAAAGHFETLLTQFDGLEKIGVSDKLKSNYDESAVLGLRLLRYQATENFLTVLLGSEPHGPVIKFAEEKFRYDAMKFATLLAEMRVHTSSEFRIDGASTFSEWLTRKIYRVRNLKPEDELPEELGVFIANAARFFATRFIYNAYKHGGRTTVGELVRLSIVDEEAGTQVPALGGFSNPLSFLTWRQSRKQKEKSTSIELGVTEGNKIEDIRAILSMTLILDAMKQSRSTSGSRNVVVQFVTDCDKISNPKTLKINLKAAS